MRKASLGAAAGTVGAACSTAGVGAAAVAGKAAQSSAVTRRANCRGRDPAAGLAAGMRSRAARDGKGLPLRAEVTVHADDVEKIATLFLLRKAPGPLWHLMCNPVQD